MTARDMSIYKTPEFRKKLSDAKMGHPVSDETRKKLSDWHTGKECPRIKISKEDLIHHFVDRDLSVSECAGVFNCSTNVIIRRLDRYGIPRLSSVVYKPTKEWLEDNYWGKQLTLAGCAKLIGCTEPTIRYHLKKCGIPIRHHGYKARAITKEWLEEHYINQNLSSFECGKLLNCDYQMILNALARHGLPPHNPVQKSKERMKDLIERGEWDPRGSNNPNWRGGRSHYCFKFNEEFKEHIRDKFGRKCYLCPTTENENKRKLSVHHTDYNKNSICNGKEWAFVPLCMRCHLKTNGDRHYHFHLLINYWAMDLDINFKAGELCNDGI